MNSEDGVTLTFGTGKERQELSEGDTLDLGTIGVLRDDVKQINIHLTNGGNKAIRDIRVSSNLSADAYRVSIPEAVLPNTTGTVLVSMKAAALWDDKVESVAFKLDYDLVKEIIT